MPASSLYQRERTTEIHRGAIFQYRPVFWLQSPLVIVRDIRWQTRPPGSADVYQRQELQDDFKRQNEDNEEDVLTRAKVRSIVVLSNDIEIEKATEVVVVPTYSLDVNKNPERVNRIREALLNNAIPYYHYLPRDMAFPDTHECYINFQQVRPLHKSFLGNGKLEVALTPKATKAILYRFIEYWRIDISDETPANKSGHL